MAELRYLLQQAYDRSQAPAMLAPDPAAMQRLLDQCHRRRYPGRTVILHPGDPADTLYYVIDGSVMVCREDDHGHELILAYINRGEFIGEMGLFVEPEQREVSVRTRGPCELAEIAYDKFFSLLEGPLRADCPRLLYAVGLQLTHRLLRTARQASRMAFLDVTQRIAGTLVDLCHEPDAMSHPDGTQIRISRQELSRIVGCSREMAGRVLKRLVEEGGISVHGKAIVVRNTR